MLLTRHFATMGLFGPVQPGNYFGLTGGWLTFWVSVACSTDMTLFGYDQGVFGMCCYDEA